MKAIVATKGGPPEVLELREVEKPFPTDDEVLIKIYAATVTRGDVIMRGLNPVFAALIGLFGMKRKKIPGHELAGEIEAVGKDVTKFKPGDQVFGTTTGSSGGSNAEYVALPEAATKGALAELPVNMTYEEAAAVPVGGMTALYILRQADIQPGQKVLVYGASGSVGTYAVQLARYFGAEVTGVCSGVNVEMVKSIGAASVIDYKVEDFTQGGETYDVVFDAVRKISASHAEKVLVESGTFLSASSSTSEHSEDLLFLKTMIEEGKLRSVIDRTYPLEQVPEAHAYVEKGHKKGNVVIQVVDDAGA